LTDYRVVAAPEAALLLKSPAYAKTAFRGSDLPRTLAHLLRSTPEDLIGGKLRYCSQDPLRDGMFLEISFFLADFHCKLKFLIQTRAVGFGAEMKKWFQRGNDDPRREPGRPGPFLPDSREPQEKSLNPKPCFPSAWNPMFSSKEKPMPRP